MYHTVYSKMILNNPYSFSHSSNPDVVPAVRCIYESNCTLQSDVPFTLDISRNRLVTFDCFYISHVMSHYPVIQLKLQYCYIGDTGAEVLAKDYSNEETVQSLELLDFRINNLTAIGMVHMMSIMTTSELFKYQLNAH